MKKNQNWKRLAIFDPKKKPIGKKSIKRYIKAYVDLMEQAEKESTVAYKQILSVLPSIGQKLTAKELEAMLKWMDGMSRSRELLIEASVPLAAGLNQKGTSTSERNLRIIEAYRTQTAGQIAMNEQMTESAVRQVLKRAKQAGKTLPNKRPK